MSSVVARTGAPGTTVAAPPPRPVRVPADRLPYLWPLLVSVASAVAFVIVNPDVGDLQAALARAFASRQGVGLGYWFQWFGGGATPGNYSVITPTISGWVGATTVGVVATVAITLLTAAAAQGLTRPLAATWVATLVAGLSMWSGRVPFAVGSAVAVGAVWALRRRQLPLVWALTVLACFSSPVTGAFLAFVLGGAFLVEPEWRARIWPVIAVAGLTLVGIAVFFGSPGPQPYAIWTALLASGAAACMLLARPAASVRIGLWLTILASPVFAIVATGMGSNWNRMPWIWLPAAVVATSTAPVRRTVLAVLPAVVMCTYLTAGDLVHSFNPAASASYYDSLIDQLEARHDLAEYRLEVVQDTSIHTAAFALLDHAALAGGYETQEQAKLNHVLLVPGLDATSYRLWLNNNAVGYVAFNKRAPDTDPEYTLVRRGGLPYLTEVSSDSRWTLYRVSTPTPIVPAPGRLLTATQASLTIDVPCACRIPVRVRFSNFLQLRERGRNVSGTVRDDGFGWTVLTTPAKGVYVLSGSVTGPLR